MQDETLGGDRAFREWEAQLTHLEREQYPYATSRALNDSMFESRKDVLRHYTEELDGGYNYFRKDLKIQKSHKDQPIIHATIGEATGYMAMQQFGHTKQSATGKQMAIPTERARRRYGTKSGKMKRSGWPSRLVRNYKGPKASGMRGGRGVMSSREPATFPMTTRDGRKMIVQRNDHASRVGGASYYAHEHFVVLYVFVDTAKVNKSFEMDKRVLKAVRRYFPKRLDMHLDKALRSAK